MSLFELSDEEAQLQSAVRGMLAGFVDNGYLNAQEEAADGFDRSRWVQLVEMGLTGIHLPSASGGADGTLVDAAIVVREVGRAAYASPLLQVQRAGTVLDAVGLAPDVVAQIADGGIVVLVAPEGDTLTAERTAGGVVLHGAPIPVEWISQSERVVVVAGTGGAENVVAVLSTADIAARLTDVPSIDNERIALWDPEGVVVDAAASVIVEATVARRAVARAELLRASLMVGGAQAVVALTSGYVKERKQFGAALASFQAVKHHAARMVIATDGAQLLCDDAILRDGDDRDESAIARAALFAAGRAYVDVVLTGAQLHGGIGTTLEHILHHHFRRAKAMQLRSGQRASMLRALHEELVVQRAAAAGSLW